jgi:DNA mismatch endonuclease (patch repair protein)
MDRVSKQVRSRIMSSVKTTDTGAELQLRSLVHIMGYRYSLHRRDLPGKPDLVFCCRKKIIFVHGCFWHGHACRYGRLPKSKLDYWEPKIQSNTARDKRQQAKLRRQGWSVMVVWQCQLRRIDALTKRIRRFLDDSNKT